MTEPNEVRPLHPSEFLPELALGVLSEPDAAAVREHLAGCAECTLELREIERVAAMLPFAVEDSAPSSAMKAGLMERIAREPRRLRPHAAEHRPPWFWLGAAAAGIAVLVLAGVAGFLIGDNGGSSNGALQAENLRTAALVQSVANGTVATTRVTENGTTATLLRAPGSSDAYAWLEGLPPLPAGKAYQAWLTTDGKKMEPSTVFSNGQGVWLIAGSDFGSYQAVALTIEDAGGARQPTQAPFFEVQLDAHASGLAPAPAG